MSEEKKLEQIDIRELFQLLPHRYPFLLLDKVIDVDSNDSATGVKNVTFNEEFFNGHFPGAPVMPGVLVIEAMAQTAGAICSKASGDGPSKLVYFMTIDNAKFRKMVVPGDVLHLRVVKIKQRGEIFKYQCMAYVDDDKVAEAVITAMMVTPEEEG